MPERDAIVFRDRRLSRVEVGDRTRRLARFLHERGLGAHGSRAGVPGWVSTQDHVALYLHNGNEYLEGMLGSYKARCVPINVNYRYRSDELRHVLATTAGRRVVVYHLAFASTLAEVVDRSRCPRSPRARRRRIGKAAHCRAHSPTRRCSPERSRCLPSDLVDVPVARRPLRLLHGRHDRRAERRAVASGRLPRLRAGIRRRDGGDIESLDELAATAPRSSLVALPAPAADARRRPLERHLVLGRRRDRGDPGPSRAVRPRRRAGGGGTGARRRRC